MDDDYDVDLSRNDNWTDDYFNNMDTSQSPFPNTLWIVRSPKEMAIKSTLTVLLAIVGLFLNSIILFIIIKNKWLWTASNMLVGNMALIDFLTLLVCPWFMLVRDFYQADVLMNFGCKFEGFMQGSLLLAGVGALVLICYDRIASAVMTAEARISKKTAPKLIIGTWVIASCLSLPWATRRYYFERIWSNYIEKYCVEDVQILGVYWHFTLTVLVWVPMGIMLLTYTAIIWRLECSARQLSTRGNGRCLARARARAVRIMACVLLVAVLCRVPFTALVYWRKNLELTINAVDGSYSILWFAANYLMYANCALNPLIYGFTNTRLKKAMDRTKPIAYFRFGSWCCNCQHCKRKQIDFDDKHTEKIFVIENSPRPNKKIQQLFKNILHINKECLDLSHQEPTAKPTKCTPLPKTEQV